MYDTIILLGAPLLRSVGGWVHNSLKDGKIDMYEWKKLAKTILRLGIPSLALFYGLNLTPELAATIPLIVDYGFDYIKKGK